MTSLERERPDRRIRRRLRRRPLMLVPSADRQLRAAVGADDQLRVVRVYRRTGISVDRLAMHPLDEVAGRERPHARGVPGEAGVVEEIAPLAARAAAEERGGIDPVLRTAAGDGRAWPCCASTRMSPPGPGGATGARRRRCRGARPSAASAPPGRPLGRRSANTRRRDRRGRPGTSAGARQCAAATTRPASTAFRRRPTARSGPARRRGAAAAAAMARARYRRSRPPVRAG